MEIETESGAAPATESANQSKEEAPKQETAAPVSQSSGGTQVTSGPGKYIFYSKTIYGGHLDSKALSTPAVRHFAKKNGLDINTIPGTGKGGRVTKEDVINFMEGKSPQAS